MKNKFNIAYLIFTGVMTAVLFTSFALVLWVLDVPQSAQLGIIIILTIFTMIIVGLIGVSYMLIKRKREYIARAFDNYIEEQISSTGLGAIIFNADSDIIWTSKFIETRMKKSIIGKNVNSLGDDFARNFIEGKKEFRFSLDEIMFEAKVNMDSKTIILKDVTNEDMLMRQYSTEKLVIGEIEIDNFQQYQVTLSEEEQFKIQSHVISMLDSLVQEYNLVYRQYVNGKYVFFTNQASLKKMIHKGFNFLDVVREVKIQDGVTLTISVGIGSGTIIQKDLAELARDGLRQAQARGGDQIALMTANKKPEYFGSKVEIGKTISRVKIKQASELFNAKIKSPEITNVVIYGHAFADLDAAGAALGIAEIAKSYGKPYVIGNVTFDITTEKALKAIFDKDELQVFVKPTRASKETTSSTLVVIVDTSELNRIENEDALKRVESDNIFIFDHHRVSKLPEGLNPQNVYIDTSASSASEIVTEVLHFVDNNIKLPKQIAQMLLNGIYLDTKSFNKSTSSRTYSAAAYLEDAGASSYAASEALKIPQEAFAMISQILTDVKEVKPGYFMAVTEAEMPSDVISMAADEILRAQGRKAAFVVAKVPGKNEYKLSARGIETNVQTIAENVGGGGHFGAAAAVSTEHLAIFEDNIRQAIVSKKGDE